MGLAALARVAAHRLPTAHVLDRPQGAGRRGIGAVGRLGQARAEVHGHRGCLGCKAGPQEQADGEGHQRCRKLVTVLCI